MAASTNTRPRRDQTPGVVSGNRARELNHQVLERRLETSGQLDFDQQYRRRKETEAELIARQRARAKAAVRPAQKVSPAAALGFAAVSALTVLLLLCYVEMNAISTRIVTMKSEIEQLEIEQVSLMAQYEQAFDMATVKEAAEEAGMTQPSDSQIYYVSLPGEDQAVAVNQQEEGVISQILAFLGQRFYAMVEYFS